MLKGQISIFMLLFIILFGVGIIVFYQAYESSQNIAEKNYLLSIIDTETADNAQMLFEIELRDHLYSIIQNLDYDQDIIEQFENEVNLATLQFNDLRQKGYDVIIQQAEVKTTLADNAKFIFIGNFEISKRDIRIILNDIEIVVNADLLSMQQFISQYDSATFRPGEYNFKGKTYTVTESEIIDKSAVLYSKFLSAKLEQ